MTQAMRAGRRGALGNRERQVGGEAAERFAHTARVDAAPAVESEQRRTRFGSIFLASALEVEGQHLPDERSEGNEAALAELATMDDEELPVCINIVQVQAAGLPDPEPETVAEGEDGMVGRAPAGGPGVVG